MKPAGRTLKQNLLLFSKGLAMGAADVVPGVSGGTIAFISGIYEELLGSLRSVNLRAIKLLKDEGVGAFWLAINGNFLVVLFAGVLTSIASLARLVNVGLETHPILVWSFFFGLIAASVIYIFRQLPGLRWQEWLGLWIGTLAAMAIAFLPPLQVSDALWVVFLSGALAICAMILPGISGSFILLLIGMYPVVIEAISAFNMPLLAVFLLGCCTGLLVFSRFLSWLLQRYHGPTIAVLTGFLLGSLLIVWPWKEALEVIVNSKGHEVVLTHRLVMPAEYGAVTGIDPQTTQALLLMMLGAVLVLGLEYLGGRSARVTGTQPQQRL